MSDRLDDVEADTCIDTDRVLPMGFAVGGVFGSIVACEQMGSTSSPLRQHLVEGQPAQMQQSKL